MNSKACLLGNSAVSLTLHPSNHCTACCPYTRTYLRSLRNAMRSFGHMN